MKQVLFLIFLFASTFLQAQDLKPLTWKFSAKKGANANEYIITASASLQKEWHVFAPNPGGDGLLIPTEISITNKNAFKTIGALTPQRRPITKEMEGIGMVNYYEGDIEFNIVVEAIKPTTIEGIITSQCCNDKMCLPPSDVPFKIKL